MYYFSGHSAAKNEAFSLFRELTSNWNEPLHMLGNILSHRGKVGQKMRGDMGFPANIRQEGVRGGIALPGLSEYREKVIKGSHW